MDRNRGRERQPGDGRHLQGASRRLRGPAGKAIPEPDPGSGPPTRTAAGVHRLPRPCRGPGVTDVRAKPSQRHWWSWGGAGIGFALLAFVLWRIDYQRFGDVLAHARVEYLALVPAAIALEQLVRAWKWRQILHPLRSVGTLRLFGAIMAGYLGNLLIPFGVSPLLRSWLVARLDRLIDGVVFAILVAVVLTLAVFPDPTGNLRLGLIVGATGSLVLFLALLWLLAQHKRRMADATSRLKRLASHLPLRLAVQSQRLLTS